MTHHIKESCGFPVNKSPTILYDKNAACISQLREWYIKSDRTKHIPPRVFSYTHELIKNNHIDIKYIQSSKNSADLFTKALPTVIFRKHVHNIGMWHLHTMWMKIIHINLRGRNSCTVLFSLAKVFPTGFYLVRF